MMCARCNFSADDLAEHAAESGHRLCIVDQRRSLTEHEAQTCASCIGRVRVDLADIGVAYAFLEPRSVTALTLLGDGTMQRRARAEELAVGTRDEWPTDPLPILAALMSWEDFIREHYSEPKGEPRPDLTTVIGWLTRNLDARLVIAQTFPAFDELATEVRRHRSAVQHDAGLADDPLRAPVACFDCGGQLVRVYRPASDPADVREERQALIRYIAACDAAVALAKRSSRQALPIWQQRRVAWVTVTTPRTGQEREGLTDEWECGGCRRVYTQAEYYLALRAALEAS